MLIFPYLGSKQAARAVGVEGAVMVLSAVVGLLDVLRLGQQAHKETGPRTAETCASEGV